MLAVSKKRCYDFQTASSHWPLSEKKNSDDNRFLRRAASDSEGEKSEDPESRPYSWSEAEIQLCRHGWDDTKKNIEENSRPERKHMFDIV